MPFHLSPGLRPGAFLLMVIFSTTVGCRTENAGSTEAGRMENSDATGETEASTATDSIFFNDQLPAAKRRALTSEEIENGWISLFDHESLFGWRDESDANFRVEEGAIVVDTGSKPGLLRTSIQYDNYQLRVDFLSDVGTNSGVFLRTPRQGTKPAENCYELNIADDGTNPFPTGSLVERAKANGTHDKLEWQTFTATVDGPNVTIDLDGETINEYVDPMPLGRGYIGLQYNSGKVAFTNISLKPLGLQSIFNGKDLSGWKEYPEMASKFAVTPTGELNVKNGRGQLETEESYGDFIFQFSCITHARNLNSGLFFRCIPGEEMNGYESQIHHGYLNDDRSDPEDHGTGGIFRFVKARKVVANDLEWFHETLIAQGPQISVWVNGQQVTDWTDTREPDPNPRRGKRVEAGTIMIQGHDETTDVSFRDLKIREMSKR